MKRIDFKTYQNNREWIVTIKAVFWLIVLFYGDPGLVGAIVALIERLG